MKKSELKQLIREEIQTIKSTNWDNPDLALTRPDITRKSSVTNKSILDIYNIFTELDDIDTIQEFGWIISRWEWDNRGDDKRGFQYKQKIFREIQKHLDDKNMINDLETEYNR